MGGFKESIARDCLTGKMVKYDPVTGKSTGTGNSSGYGVDIPFIGPGLVDLQVNGINGVDFNSVSLDEEGLIAAARYLKGRGVTTFFPTVITNTKKDTFHILSVINKACLARPFLQQCIGGVHLEGPFISGEDGYRGAHNRELVRLPDLSLFQRYQEAAGNRIRIVTISPELDNSADFISKCWGNGIIVSLGHSNAGREDIDAAIAAGATLFSHLGNGLPLNLPRHPNILWEVLSKDDLYASIIADGFHLPDSFIRVVMKAKGRKAVLISDATCFSGLPPGFYRSSIGAEVVLGEDGRLSMKQGGGLLAGSAKDLLDNVQYLISNQLAEISTAWSMASALPAKVVGLRNRSRVVFSLSDGKITINRVYERETL
jgi:N-acetylglucosamine-6-phosphate deacetylase